MTVIDFPNPFVMREHRRCRSCRETVLTFCLNGAECPRQGVFACADCGRTPEATDARVVALTMVQPELDSAA